MTIVIVNQARSRSFVELSYEISSRNYVTQHPVENAVDTGDHIQIQPDEIRCEVVESNQRYGYDAAPQGALTYTGEAELFLAAARGELLTLSFKGRPLLTGYALTSINRRKDNSDRLLFSLAFKQIRLARAFTVRIPPALTNRSGGADRQSLGSEAGNNARDGLAAGFLKSIGFLE